MQQTVPTAHTNIFEHSDNFEMKVVARMWHKNRQLAAVIQRKMPLYFYLYNFTNADRISKLFHHS